MENCKQSDTTSRKWVRRGEQVRQNSSEYVLTDLIHSDVSQIRSLITYTGLCFCLSAGY